MKIYDFWLRFHWNSFLSGQLTMFQHWFRQWLGADQVQFIIWTNEFTDAYMRHSASMSWVKSNINFFQWGCREYIWVKFEPKYKHKITFFR